MNTFREGAASMENPFACEEMVSPFSFIGKNRQEEMSNEASDIIVLGLKLKMPIRGLEGRWLRWTRKVLNTLKHIVPEMLWPPVLFMF